MKRPFGLRSDRVLQDLQVDGTLAVIRLIYSKKYRVCASERRGLDNLFTAKEDRVQYSSRVLPVDAIACCYK